MKRQPVITGLGIVSPIGVGVEKFWAAACAGQSGIRTPTLFDASKLPPECRVVGEVTDFDPLDWMPPRAADRKSTRLNSSHLVISYAVFCLKKKKIKEKTSVEEVTTSNSY